MNLWGKKNINFFSPILTTSVLLFNAVRDWLFTCMLQTLTVLPVEGQRWRSESAEDGHFAILISLHPRGTVRFPVILFAPLPGSGGQRYIHLKWEKGENSLHHFTNEVLDWSFLHSGRWSGSTLVFRLWWSPVPFKQHWIAELLVVFWSGHSFRWFLWHGTDGWHEGWGPDGRALLLLPLLNAEEFCLLEAQPCAAAMAAGTLDISSTPGCWYLTSCLKLAAFSVYSGACISELQCQQPQLLCFCGRNYS